MYSTGRLAGRQLIYPPSNITNKLIVSDAHSLELVLSDDSYVHVCTCIHYTLANGITHIHTLTAQLSHDTIHVSAWVRKQRKHIQRKHACIMYQPQHLTLNFNIRLYTI